MRGALRAAYAAVFVGVLGFYVWQLRPPSAAGAASPASETGLGQILNQLLRIHGQQLDRARMSSDGRDLAQSGPVNDVLGALSSLSAAPRPAAAPATRPLPANAGPGLFEPRPTLQDTRTLRVEVRRREAADGPYRPGRAVLRDATHVYEITSPPPPAASPLSRLSGAMAPGEPSPPPNPRRRAALGLAAAVLALGGGCVWARRRLLGPS